MNEALGRDDTARETTIPTPQPREAQSETVSNQPTGNTITYAVGIDPYPRAKYTITITPLDNGFNVMVGCKLFAITSAKKLTKLLTKYLLNPNETIKEYNEGKLF